MKQPYRDFCRAVSRLMPGQRMITDPLELAAVGTDASFYSLVPQVILEVKDEHQVCLVLREARKRKLPVTFRAAGTSLSGQAVTDSVLIRLGRGWEEMQIFDNARRIRLGPGLVGGDANRRLAVLDKKIGPDPASIDAAQMGGILANNASGMCCGTAQNSYQTLDSIRLVLADSTLVDTGDDLSTAEFRKSHAHLLDRLANLRKQVMADPVLAERIRHKFKIKNTTGYSLNALIDFEDPLDIMAHLMIGSEGTLAFISSAVLKTVVEHRHKATALVLFTCMADACQAIPVLRTCPVAAAEIMDRASLASVEDKPGMPDFLKGLDDGVTALLIETRAESPQELTRQADQITAKLAAFDTVRPVSFSFDPKACQALWKIRKGLFPAVGAVRQTGTTVIIEDVAFPQDHLAEAAQDLQTLFKTYGYTEAIIFGHAFEGNLHFVFTQDFSHSREVDRYSRFMADVVDLVVEKYDGSLKAEHGTGRNMAPFVEKEWGAQAYALMQEIKEIFDPENLLNPGVILNPDAQAHVRHLKSMPAAHKIADKCIECGFCEPVCPSRNLSFTPRQRIAGRREIERHITSGSRQAKKLAKSYQYPGMDTCAADGLCSTRCPVEIDTGKMVKALRGEARGPLAKKIADMTANKFETATQTIRHTLNTVDTVHRFTGTPFMETASTIARKASAHALPQWNREMPRGGGKIQPEPASADQPLKVVYFPACVSRSMGGPSRMDDAERQSLSEKTCSLLKKAGYQIIFPEEMDRLCCGQAFESKGFVKTADEKMAALSQSLMAASQNGKIPVLCDTSPCLMRIKDHMAGQKIRVFEPVEFVLEFLMDRLEFTPKQTKIAIHPTCSTRKMGLEHRLLELARACAREVVWPEDIYCCGFAGDKGFNQPELNRSALAGLADQVCTCEAGYSTSKTCEIGLSLHSGIPYRSILYLVDEVTRAKP